MQDETKKKQIALFKNQFTAKTFCRSAVLNNRAKQTFEHFLTFINLFHSTFFSCYTNVLIFEETKTKIKNPFKDPVKVNSKLKQSAPQFFLILHKNK